MTYNSIYTPSTSAVSSFSLKLFSQGVTQIVYYPSFLVTLRNAFSQYFSLLVVTMFLATWLLNHLASRKVFPLHVEEREFRNMIR